MINVLCWNANYQLAPIQCRTSSALYGTIVHSHSHVCACVCVYFNFIDTLPGTTSSPVLIVAATN